MLVYINSEMTKPEDMTIEEIREQLALYNRLYYNKRREDKEYLDKKRASRDRYLEKKKIEKYIAENGIDISVVKLTPEQKAEALATKKKGTKYTMKNCKVITVIPEEEPEEEK